MLCYQACHKADRIIIREICVLMLLKLMQVFKCELSPWLWTCVSHFAVAYWRPHPPLWNRQPNFGRNELPVAMVSYFARGTLGIGHGIVKVLGHRAATGWLRRSLWVGKFTSLAFAGLRLVIRFPSVTANSSWTLEGRSPHSFGIGCRKVLLLLTGRHLFPQFQQKYWGKLYAAINLDKCYFLRLKHNA